MGQREGGHALSQGRAFPANNCGIHGSKRSNLPSIDRSNPFPRKFREHESSWEAESGRAFYGRRIKYTAISGKQFIRRWLIFDRRPSNLRFIVLLSVLRGSFLVRRNFRGNFRKSRVNQVLMNMYIHALHISWQWCSHFGIPETWRDPKGNEYWSDNYKSHDYIHIDRALLN